MGNEVPASTGIFEMGSSEVCGYGCVTPAAPQTGKLWLMAVFFVLAISFLVFGAVVAARLLLSLFALELGAQPVTVGLLAATFSLFPMLLSVAAGKVADRFGSRFPILLGTAGGACGMLVPYFFPGLPALFVAAAINGISFAFYGVALQNDVGLLSRTEDRARNFSNFSLMGAAVNLVAPLLAGVSIDHMGHATTCIYIAWVSLLPLAMLALWGRILPAGKRPVSAQTGSMIKSLADRGVWKVLATSSIVISGMDLFQFYMPVYGHSLGLPASTIGLILGMFAAAGFVVRLILARLINKFGVERLLAYSFYLGAVSFMLLPFFKNVAMLALLAFVFGLGVGCGNPIITMLMFNRSAPGRSGEGLGLRMTVNHLTRAVGPVVFGSIGSTFGLFAVFWLNALLLASGGMISRTKK